MSLRYIREYYGFTGKRGNACKVMGGKSGVITGSDGQYVRVRLHGENKSRIFHPSDIMFERKNESGLTKRAADCRVRCGLKAKFRNPPTANANRSTATWQT